MRFDKAVFDTSNKVLALCLSTCGVPWLDPRKPCTNEYTPELLAAGGFAKIDDAIAAGVPGKVTYFFERTDSLGAILKAFDEQQEANKAAKFAGGVGAELDIEPEVAVRVACQTLKNRPDFYKIWRQMIPDLRIENAGKPRRRKNADGSTTITVPGCRIASQNASEETLKHLKML